MPHFSTNDKSDIQPYSPNSQRYQDMDYVHCGKTGLVIPRMSLGLWHNFGDRDCQLTARNIIRTAFDNGITHFDLANNYGPSYGSAESNFGRILKQDFTHYRDELIISTKAGYDMWPGPYGVGGSRKYLIASLNQSLKRLGLDYVDIFYHHVPDPNTPLEETMMALQDIVKSGKALYVAISNYPAKLAAKAYRLLDDLGTPAVLNQIRYSMLDRWVEDDGLLNCQDKYGVGTIAFSPLAQGLLTNNYLKKNIENTRAAKDMTYLTKETVEGNLEKIRALNEMAEQRGQTLAQMALAWLLKDPRVSSTLVGASSAAQLLNSLKALNNTQFSDEELIIIEHILKN